MSIPSTSPPSMPSDVARDVRPPSAAEPAGGRLSFLLGRILARRWLLERREAGSEASVPANARPAAEEDDRAIRLAR